MKSIEAYRDSLLDAYDRHRKAAQQAARAALEALDKDAIILARERLDEALRASRELIRLSAEIALTDWPKKTEAHP